MSGGVQQKIQHLIELAARAPDGDAEGRNAAMQACKLIRQHGLLVVTPEELVTVPAPCPPPPSPVIQRQRSASRPPPTGPRRRWQDAVPKEVVEVVSTAAGDALSGALRDMLRGR